MTTVKKLIAGNWKMHGLKADGLALARAVSSTAAHEYAEVLICPPFTLLFSIADTLKNTSVLLGAQDCHEATEGAYTGNISAHMLKDAGCSHVIVGHSERRQQHGETSAQVSKKAAAANQENLVTIICVGETEEERNAGNTLTVIERQLKESVPASANAKNTVIAYEPVWAIGTGNVPTNQNILEVHQFIRAFFKGTPLPALYGGSVKADNAKEILAIDGVDGVLVGGASLKAEEFISIIGAAK